MRKSDLARVITLMTASLLSMTLICIIHWLAKIPWIKYELIGTFSGCLLGGALWAIWDIWKEGNDESN